MPPRDPYKLPSLSRRFDNLRVALNESLNRPYIGLTQGGSSRKWAGCKSAANKGLQRAPKPLEPKET